MRPGLYPAIVTIAALASFSGSAAGAQELQDGQSPAFEAAFGVTLGKSIIPGVARACPFVLEEMANAEADDPVLLLTDDQASGFYSGRCEGSCDMVETDRIIMECRQDRGIDQCIPFAAIHDGELFDLSIDPTGAPLGECLR